MVECDSDSDGMISRDGVDLLEFVGGSFISPIFWESLNALGF